MMGREIMNFLYGRISPLAEFGKIGSGHEERWSSPGMSPVTTVEMSLTVCSRTFPSKFVRMQRCYCYTNK
jgi:hypothetical protein